MDTGVFVCIWEQDHDLALKQVYKKDLMPHQYKEQICGERECVYAPMFPLPFTA